ncbi:MAG TPA: histidine kinase dimerization/phospho-acceptor domain-containing protein [Candidatus Dormibacteraeota bacterium]|nr:histidine kinase dimerization/phospho-acceptor domain-containing protein [Candidatus Dormibacteraeota bacterium]
MSKRSQLWLAAVGGMMAAMVVAAVILPQSFRLTAFSDIIQSLLLLSGSLAFVPLILRSRGRIRVFWSLITLGSVLWLAYQLFWTYYEVVLRLDVPDLCTWDVVLFLHIVPMMAALALRPQFPRDEYSARVGRLDFALLLVWWLYLYILIVMPWQYVMADIPTYNRNLNDVYIAEKLVLLVGLLASSYTSKGEWRKVYAGLFGMSFCYSAISTIENWAIARKTYYSGSLYDIPLVLSMACLTWIGLTAKVEEPDHDTAQASTPYGIWVARCSMIAVFSLPLFAAWAMSDEQIPQKIRIFRLALTLVAAFCMGIMILVRQQMLDRELVRLLNQSRESFDNLKRLQAQILQSEKLASIGQLVGGAAHELNNPLTAMLGYSDLLLSTTLTSEQRPLAAKIGQYVRRAKSLVASLVSFARQAPAPQTPLDLNTLARTAVKLTQPQWNALEIEVRTELDNALPKVLGDSNQMLQVCLQLVANGLHVLAERGGKVMTVSTERHGSLCVLQIATEPVTLSNDDDHASSPVDPEDGLGLSACQGILQEHRGRISRERREDGALLFRMELPATEAARANTKEATVPVLWKSRPYA